MPWYDWFTYAKDPVARTLLGEVLDRLDTFVVQATTVANGHTPIGLAPPARDLDCGHRQSSYAVYRDGRTTCYACHDPLRGNFPGSI